MKIAKPIHRIMAALLDFSIIFLFVFAFSFAVVPILIRALLDPNIEIGSRIAFDIFRFGISTMIFLIVYFVAIPFYMNGQTFGKKLFSIKVVNENSEKASLGRLFFREAIAKIFIDFLSLGVTTFVSLIIMLIREDNSSLSDIIAKTKVVDIKKEVL